LSFPVNISAENEGAIIPAPVSTKPVQMWQILLAHHECFCRVFAPYSS
jgi:hypothetical protein